jgi:hypothetical protein
MKQKDVILIVIVAFVSAILAFVISNTFINSPKNRSTTAEVVEPIVADFPSPDKRYFNENSINPTQLIRIGENTNPSPFNSN